MFAKLVAVSVTLCVSRAQKYKSEEAECAFSDMGTDRKGNGCFCRIHL